MNWFVSAHVPELINFQVGVRQLGASYLIRAVFSPLLSPNISTFIYLCAFLAHVVVADLFFDVFRGGMPSTASCLLRNTVCLCFPIARKLLPFRASMMRHVAPPAFLFSHFALFSELSDAFHSVDLVAFRVSLPYSADLFQSCIFSPSDSSFSSASSFPVGAPLFHNLPRAAPTTVGVGVKHLCA